MIQKKIVRGYDCYELYYHLFRSIMFNNQYEYCNHKLLKRYIAYTYVKMLRGK